MIRVRITYAKTDYLKYTGNLDMHKIWERSFRRAHLPLAYSQGFHPQPKLQQGCPLPLGMTSSAEILDAWLEDDLTTEAIHQALKGKLPPGIDLLHMEIVPGNSPALQTRVIEAEYLAQLPEDVERENIEQKISSLLNASILPRQRQGKRYDLRPLIHALSLEIRDNRPYISMRLSAREGATGRPEEVLAALDIDPYSCRIDRTNLVLT